VVHIISANHIITRQAILGGQGMKFIAIKVEEANIGGDPNKARTVLLHAINDLGRQAVLDIKMHKLLLTDLAV
jgi:hypothetical protein